MGENSRFSLVQSDASIFQYFDRLAQCLTGMQEALRALKLSAGLLAERLESLTIPYDATLGQSWICFCRHLKLAAPIGDQEVVLTGHAETGTEAERICVLT